MEKYTDDVALLVGKSGPLEGQRWAIRDSILIGRDPTCDIVIPDRQISRQHARIQVGTRGIFLEDLDSKNGTHLNGIPINEGMLLQDGDVIQIALTQRFVYLSSDATVPLDISNLDLSRLEPGKPLSEEGEEDEVERRLRLDSRSRRVWIREVQRESMDKEELTLVEIEITPPLSAYQFHLLEQLCDHQGRVVSRRELIAAVWGKEQAVEVSEQALDALVRRLRERLEAVDPSHQYIVTVRGHGLRLENPSLSIENP